MEKIMEKNKNSKSKRVKEGTLYNKAYATAMEAEKKTAEPSALARKNRNKKTLGEKQYENFKTALDTKFDKMSRIQKTYEGASPKIKKDLENKFKDSFKSKNTVASTRRETGRTEVAKGGRINFKGGGCAIRGIKKNAYGKNS
jgi:hypothetical protein